MFRRREKAKTASTPPISDRLGRSSGARTRAANAGSILSVDFGNTHTRAILIDRVDGVYTQIAQATELTTAGFPHGDVSVGMARALRTLSAATGRRFVTPDARVITPEESDRSGVDIFIATASIGRPLRTILMGLVPEISVASGERAAAGTYVQIVDTISRDDRRTPEAQLNAIILANPDFILLVGGTENGAKEAVLELASIARLALRLMPRTQKPPVLYAGNSAIAQVVAQQFDGVTRVFLAANVRPTLEDEALVDAQLQLSLAFDTLSEARGMGFETVGAMSAAGILPNAASYELVIDYLGKLTHSPAPVLAFDVGSAISTLSAHVWGHTSTAIRTDIGVGSSARTLLDRVGLDGIRAWLPFTASDNEITAYALNKTLRPASIPDGLRALFLEHALFRAALQDLCVTARPLWTPGEAMDNFHTPLPPFERIIGAGATFTETGRPGLGTLLLLDALQPTGVTRLQMDEGALIPALGALARLHPEAVVQLLDGNSLNALGTVFNISGQPGVGRTVARVKITPANGSEVTVHTIEGGSLFIAPLPPGTHATVQISLSRGLHIGGKRRLRVEVEGGAAGIIIDARGRPLPVARDLKPRAEQMLRWMSQATGDPVHDLPPEWLIAPPAPIVTPTATVETPKRGRRARQNAALPDLPDSDDLYAIPSLDALTQTPAAMPTSGRTSRESSITSRGRSARGGRRDSVESPPNQPDLDLLLGGEISRDAAESSSSTRRRFGRSSEAGISSRGTASPPLNDEFIEGGSSDGDESRRLFP